MQFTAYALMSLVDGTLYIGHTSDIERRIKEQSWKNKFK